MRLSRSYQNSIALLLVCFIIINQSAAQILPDSTSKKIDNLFNYLNRPGSPGCTIGIVRNDSLIYAKGYGMANLEYGIPNGAEM